MLRLIVIQRHTFQKSISLHLPSPHQSRLSSLANQWHQTLQCTPKSVAFWAAASKEIRAHFECCGLAWTGDLWRPFIKLTFEPVPERLSPDLILISHEDMVPRHAIPYSHPGRLHGFFIAILFLSQSVYGRDIQIGTIPEKMQFDTPVLRARPDESIKLTLINSCRMQHNWILCQPGADSAQRVAKAALLLGAEAITRQYIPDSPLVIIGTPIVNPNESATIHFRAPKREGAYPFVCTIPGHALSMHGTLLVGDLTAPLSQPAATTTAPISGLARAQEKMKRYRPLMDSGPSLGGVIANGQDITPKGIAVKLGPNGTAGALFDTELLRYSAVWEGNFVQFLSGREDERAEYRIQIGATPIFTSPQHPGWASPRGSWHDPRSNGYGPLPAHWLRFNGHYLHEDTVVFSYDVNGTAILDSPAIKDGKFLRQLTIAPSLKPLQLSMGSKKITLPESPTTRDLIIHEDGSIKRAEVSLQRFAQGGQRRWETPIITRGKTAPSQAPYVVDTLTLPYDNPWNALLYTAGLDFFANGDAALCTSHGDVWTLSGIDEDLDQLVWNRFASGLSNPLGLKIVNDEIFVTGLDRITRLVDLNGNNEADYYESFNADCQVSERHHRFATDLQTDSSGNFYYLKCTDEGLSDHAGSLIKISPDGSQFELFATGLRNPNGMAIGPNDLITFGKQQGSWIPSSGIHVVRKNGFYGYMPSHHQAPPPTQFHQPLCWIPHGVDNSCGGQVWAPSNPRWGPLGGSLLHLSYGKCQLFYVFFEEIKGQHQGGLIRIPGIEFDSGAMRARFRNQDGQLYVTGLRGWQTSAAMPGCLQRVRYTGIDDINTPENLTVEPDGIRIHFRTALAPNSATNPANYEIEQWNYRWTRNYGSPDYKISNPDQKGHDSIRVERVILDDTGRTVLLRLSPFHPAMQSALTYRLHDAEGNSISDTLYHTIHQIPSHDAATN